MIRVVENIGEGKELIIVLVRRFLLPVKSREYADVLITDHMMTMVAVNDTRESDMNNAKGRIH